MRNSRRSRGSSAPWSRLRPVQQDPLESFGLPSKGDTRLLNHKTQESFYAIIVDRYMTFCSDAGQGDELLRRFSSLHIVENSERLRLLPAGTPNQDDTVVKFPSCIVNSVAEDATIAKGLSDILAALRKLREGIVASKRVDDFATQVYLFCIRISILAKQPESYHPAILHLLGTIHPRHSLTAFERAEVAGYLVLDAICRRNQAGEAIAMCHQYRLQDTKVKAVLFALIHKNYVVFRRLQRDIDGYKARLMEWADRDIRIHTLKCLGRAYHSVGLAFLEKTTASKWISLTRNDDVGWELEEDKVVIRRLRAR
ncbi:hypothetical protein E4U21_004537 [Claviceps maximensis]|nr:hypothetical protein E4U21_004537 [Claviceps maximensis]